MNLKELKLKFAKFISNFEEIETDKGKLMIDGDAIIGKEVYIISAEGDAVAAPDGEYKAGDITYVVVDGMISEIKKPETTPTEPVNAETDETKLSTEVKEETKEEVDTFKEDSKKLINELLSVISELDKKVSEMDAKFESIKKTPMAKTIDEQLKETKKEKEELSQEERIKRLIEFQNSINE